ncbi:TPA: filamentous hemagglutinin N-terminal domain-containing protein, partial [Campylobacter jejuni]|nr:filamentous hemagglutinin N-terminal domain-containing protein [Campylobacter jejuni]HEG0463789.1 filamentous hemagglutinin N-terminal domain-containing protein [Campylobacter jejuni]
MKNNKIVLSIVVSSLLFSQSYALPSGGKFTHGTSGSINVNGNTMNITGNKVNSVIQWGGGFNIAKNETVNFNGKNQNYLNIAYGSKSSHIDGTLNGGSNNIFLINPNGIVVGKGGSINANKVFLSTSSVGNDEMKEFATNGRVVAFEYNKDISPVIKPSAGDIINSGYVKAEYIGIITRQFSDFDEYGNEGIFDGLKKYALTNGDIIVSSTIFNGVKSLSGGYHIVSAHDYVKLGKALKETSDLITKDDISNEVLNSIFEDLKINSYANIDNIFAIYSNPELTQKLSNEAIQSINFITALYGQANTSETLKNALSNSQDFLSNASKITDVQAKLKNISDLKTQQASNKAEYDKAVKEYEDAVKAYNTALKGLTGNNADTTLAGLKQAVNNAYKKVQDSISKNEDYYTQLEGLKTEVSDISIDGEHKLTVSGSFDRNYAILPSVNSGSNNSNNGNDGTDSGDINNGNNNGSNNNPNDTIGQQEPDIATALLMQTTDEDPNI